MSPLFVYSEKHSKVPVMGPSIGSFHESSISIIIVEDKADELHFLLWTTVGRIGLIVVIMDQGYYAKVAITLSIFFVDNPTDVPNS